MRSTRYLRRFAGLTIGLVVVGGCATAASRREESLWQTYRELAQPKNTPASGSTLFASSAVLDRGELVRAVLAHNPNVAVAREALRAMLAEIPQMAALADPMLGYELAPLSIAGDMRLGQTVSVRQRLPFPGKRRLAGEAALARAEAEAAEIGVVRLELAQMTSELYDDFYVAARSLEINEHHRVLVEQMKKAAEAQYVAGRAAQQDPIQAEVELARLERERLTIESERDQIVARLNGLLHRSPGAELPPPPAELAPASAPTGTADQLQALALERRPQREAANARIRAASAKIELAERAYYPDFELMSSYSAMWDMPEHRWMVGVMIDVPIQRARRGAAVEQAHAEAARARFESERVTDEVRVEVVRAHRRMIEAQALLDVHEHKLVPAARAQLDAARAGYSSAQNSFLAVIQAQENLRQSELELAMARAELSRRRAALSRVVGVVPGLSEGGAR
jgi:outer membrane protein, heavy metal efflux system